MAQPTRAQTDEQGANQPGSSAKRERALHSAISRGEFHREEFGIVKVQDQVRTDRETDGRRRRPQTKMMPVPVAAVLRVAELPSRAPSSPTDRDRPTDRGGRGPFAFYSMKVLEQNLVRFHDHDEKGQQSRPASHATFATV